MQHIGLSLSNSVNLSNDSSARNVFAGKVDMLTNGAVNTEVLLTLPSGETIVSVVTKASAESLDLAQGKAACAIIKASDVMIGKGLDAATLSARNRAVGRPLTGISTSNPTAMRKSGRG